jgi:uncharacterized protein (TIGR03435 family)
MALGTPTLRAQTPAAARAASPALPAYDVVSIKPNNTGSGHVSIHHDDGNFDAFNVSLTTLILDTYGFKEAQIFGLPSWADSARFDIKAKVVDPDIKAIEAMTREQYRAMLVPILTGRFHLQSHRETKLLPVYELVIAKGGPKLATSTATGHQTVNGVEAGNISTRRTQFTATAAHLSSLAEHLSDQLQRVVIDKTGLTGRYDLLLIWAPDDGTPQASDSTAPSLFTAIQEQLGLKLQPGKAEVETLVIDHAELPTED